MARKFHFLGCACCNRTNVMLNRRDLLRGASSVSILSTLNMNCASAQELWSGNLSNSCSFYGNSIADDDVYTFKSVKEAEEVVGRITDHVGLPANFSIMAANVPNAAAVIRDEQRYILYSEAFMQEIVQATSTAWAGWTILAHEVGHHLSGHTLLRTGSRPNIELQADQFAGFVIARMGGSLQQAQACFRQMSTQGSATHPGRAARIEAVTVGWRRGQSGTSSSRPQQEPQEPQEPQETPQRPQEPQQPQPTTQSNPTIVLGWIIQALTAGNLNVSRLTPQMAMLYNQQRFAISQRMQFMGPPVNIQLVNQSQNPDGSALYNFFVQFQRGQMQFQLGLLPNGTITALWFN